MSNAYLQPSKLKNYRDEKHLQWKDFNVDALSAKTVRYDLEATLHHFGFTSEEKPTFQCSCKVAYRILKCKMPHTIAEELIKPYAEKMVESMVGLGTKKKIQQLLLSDHSPTD